MTTLPPGTDARDAFIADAKATASRAGLTVPERLAYVAAQTARYDRKARPDMTEQPPEQEDLLTLLRDSEQVASAALAGAEQADENADDWWRSSALRAVAQLAVSGVDFTADDVRDLGVTEPDIPNRWGGVFLAAAREGLIEPVGARRSTRGPRNASLVRVWRGKAAA